MDSLQKYYQENVYYQIRNAHTLRFVKINRLTGQIKGSSNEPYENVPLVIK